jgi:prepilin-type N-terminal cleavage/methylation domain-containing protein
MSGQQTTYHKARQGGFTLIELLVVVSIMAMLMSLLLPSLSRAGEAGKRVVCRRTASRGGGF